MSSNMAGVPEKLSNLLDLVEKLSRRMEVLEDKVAVLKRKAKV